MQYDSLADEIAHRDELDHPTRENWPRTPEQIERLKADWHAMRERNERLRGEVMELIGEHVQRSGLIVAAERLSDNPLGGGSLYLGFSTRLDGTPLEAVEAIAERLDDLADRLRSAANQRRARATVEVVMGLVGKVVES